MKPTHDNLRAEIEHRLALLHNEGPSPIIEYEKAVMTEFIRLIDLLGKKIGYKEFDQSRYTPIRCANTNEPILIGDKVEADNGRCGTLHFDTYTNKYVIKSETGGNIHTSTFYKISDLYEYTIDANRVECRPSGKYLKKKW